MNNPSIKKPRTIDIVNQSLQRRYRAERRFKTYGITAIVISLGFLAFLFVAIGVNGYSAFWQTYINLDIHFDREALQQEALATADYQSLVKSSLRALFPEVKSRSDKRKLYALVSKGASFELRKMVLNDPQIIGQRMSVWMAADDDVDMLLKGHILRDQPEGSRRLTDKQLAWIDRLIAEGKLEKRFN